MTTGYPYCLVLKLTLLLYQQQDSKAERRLQVQSSSVSMDVDLKKRLYADGLARELPGVGDAEEQMVLGDLAEDDTFEIPLKTGHSRSSNFPELDEDFSCVQDASNGSVEKKVRFEPGDEPAVRRDDETSRSRSDSLRGKKNVEDLLQYATQVNDYLAQNMDKINTFRTALLNDDQLYRPLSNAATQATTLSASMSNFELSDNEGDDQDRLSPPPTAPQLSRTDYGVLNKSNDSLLNTVPRNFSSPNSIDSGSKHSVDHTLENSPQVDNTDVLNSPEIDQYLHNLVLRQQYKSKDTQDENSAAGSPQEHSLILTHENTSVHEVPDLTQEEGMAILQDTIEHILKLSEKEAPEVPEQHISTEFASFTMKSTPTVTYKQLLSRIQSKCMFGSIVYLVATFLIQTCFLTRNEEGRLILRRPLTQNQTHRLVIATVRVATKLLEDFVHSHQYFCKVCGISKKLLTKLEVALIICVKNDGLMITSEKLAATMPIEAELKCNESN